MTLETENETSGNEEAANVQSAGGLNESIADGAAASSDAASPNEGDHGDEQQVNTPEFAEVQNESVPPTEEGLARIQDIKVTVSADLGRTTLPIQTLMNLGTGSVLELDREIGSPVELVAQGVKLACGEVVVVDGFFAVRVTEVFDGKQG